MFEDGSRTSGSQGRGDRSTSNNNDNDVNNNFPHTYLAGNGDIMDARPDSYSNVGNDANWLDEICALLDNDPELQKFEPLDNTDELFPPSEDGHLIHTVDGNHGSSPPGEMRPLGLYVLESQSNYDLLQSWPFDQVELGTADVDVSMDISNPQLLTQLHEGPVQLPPDLSLHQQVRAEDSSSISDFAVAQIAQIVPQPRPEVNSPSGYGGHGIQDARLPVDNRVVPLIDETPRRANTSSASSDSMMDGEGESEDQQYWISGKLPATELMDIQARVENTARSWCTSLLASRVENMYGVKRKIFPRAKKNEWRKGAHLPLDEKIWYIEMFFHKLPGGKSLQKPRRLFIRIENNAEVSQTMVLGRRAQRKLGLMQDSSLNSRGSGLAGLDAAGIECTNKPPADFSFNAPVDLPSVTHTTPSQLGVFSTNGSWSSFADTSQDSDPFSGSSPLGRIFKLASSPFAEPEPDGDAVVDSARPRL